MKIVSVDEMRAIEQASVRLGVSLEALQEKAAAALAREIERIFGVGQGILLFLAGSGNNGRDALIAADLLRQKGCTLLIYLAPGVGSEDVLLRLREGGAEIYRHAGAADLDLLRRWVREASAVVDGLLGIGIRGAVREPMAGMISAAAQEAAACRVPVVAVDLPSGIDADTGQIAGCALPARYTVSLGCVKAGLLKFPAARYVGELIPVGIGLPPESYQRVRMELLDVESVAKLIPPRPLEAHKGSFGRVLVVAGSRFFVGAPYLVGAAAARAGCGLVTFAVPEWQRASLAVLLPEATYLPLLDCEDTRSSEANAQVVAEALPDCAALALGPGLGQGLPQRTLVMRILETAARLDALGTVVDADGLNALAGEGAVNGSPWWERIGPGHVLTPHPGEMSRLAGIPIGEVSADRWGVAQRASRQWGQVVVLKGAFTVVAEPGGDTWVSPFALPALASGGTGDVLTGLIAGLMAQGAKPVEAARAGVFLHAVAAEQVLDCYGADRLLATDLLPEIPRAIRRVMSDES